MDGSLTPIRLLYNHLISRLNHHDNHHTTSSFQGVGLYKAALPCPWKRLILKGERSWEGISPRLSSDRSFPTSGPILNPWPKEWNIPVSEAVLGWSKQAGWIKLVYALDLSIPCAIEEGSWGSCSVKASRYCSAKSTLPLFFNTVRHYDK